LAVDAAVKPCASGAPLTRLWGLTAPPRQATGSPCREGRRVLFSRPVAQTRAVNVCHIKSWLLQLNHVQFPTDIVFLVVFFRLRYKLSLRDLAEMFLIRGLVFTHEAVRDWEAKLAPLLSEALRKRRAGTVGRCWHTDETYVKVAGKWCYLYRTIDRDGNLVDVYLSETRDLAAAKAFFRSAHSVTQSPLGN